MKKGDLVKVKDAEFKHFNNPAGFRPTTQEERDEWRAELTRDIQAGLTEWHDSGGPSTGEQFYMPRADLEVVSER